MIITNPFFVLLLSCVSLVDQETTTPNQNTTTTTTRETRQRNQTKTPDKTSHHAVTKQTVLFESLLRAKY